MAYIPSYEIYTPPYPASANPRSSTHSSRLFTKTLRARSSFPRSLFRKLTFRSSCFTLSLRLGVCIFCIQKWVCRYVIVLPFLQPINLQSNTNLNRPRKFYFVPYLYIHNIFGVCVCVRRNFTIWVQNGYAFGVLSSSLLLLLLLPSLSLLSSSPPPSMLCKRVKWEWEK